VNPPLLKVNIIMDQTDRMHLLEAVNFLDSEIKSTTTETETKTEHDTNNSSMNEHLMPRRSKITAKVSMIDQAVHTQEESSDAIPENLATIASSRVKKTRKFQDVSSERSKKRPKTASVAPTKCKIFSFEERCEMLLIFKEEFGHCNVPLSRNRSLGDWCKSVRLAHVYIQQGKKPKIKLSQDRIERLEAIGFQWKLRVHDPDEVFEQRCRDLEAFKSEFGHCDVPYTYSADPALGHWCSTIR
jgi:hypothetical protein